MRQQLPAWDLGSIAMIGVSICPDRLFTTIYNTRSDATLSRGNEYRWKLKCDKQEWKLPAATDALRITHIAAGYERTGYQRLLEKYQLKDFVELTPSDTVLDIGSYIGEFAVAAQDVTDQVYPVEPDPLNAKYCAANCETEVENVAVWSTPGEVTIRAAEDGSESGVNQIDRGGLRERVSVPARTLDQLIENTCASFVKLECEGVEPEALDGLERERPAKVAIDAGAERNGESVLEEVSNRLQQRNYQIRTRGDIVFGSLKSDS